MRDKNRVRLPRKMEMRGGNQPDGCAEVRESSGDCRPLEALLSVDAGSLHLAFERRV